MKSNELYVQAVDKLIPEAEKIARIRMEKAGKPRYYELLGKDGQPYRFDNWTHEFHKAMNELKRKRGLIKW